MMKFMASRRRYCLMKLGAIRNLEDTLEIVRRRSIGLTRTLAHSSRCSWGFGVSCGFHAMVCSGRVWRLGFIP